jgi:hypothetical protein
MKRTVLILLSAIYLLSTLGVAADSYYCHGKLQSTSVIIQRSSSPDCKMHDQMKNCCKTKKQFFKVIDLHIYAASLSLGARVFPVIQVSLLVSQFKVNMAVQEVSYVNISAPPKGIVNPVYILNCNYRI